jgi:competence ComEA-like helix-hairpin-helix protein
MNAQYWKLGSAAIAAVFLWIAVTVNGRASEPANAPWQEVNEQVEAWLAAMESAQASEALSAPVDARKPSDGMSPARPAAPVSDAASMIDMNTATAAQWVELPGIGKAKAEAIIAYREANGPFRRIEEIMNVKGIGPAIFEKIQGRIAAGSTEQEK